METLKDLLEYYNWDSKGFIGEVEKYKELANNLGVSSTDLLLLAILNKLENIEMTVSAIGNNLP